MFLFINKLAPLSLPKPNGQVIHCTQAHLTSTVTVYYWLQLPAARKCQESHLFQSYTHPVRPRLTVAITSLRLDYSCLYDLDWQAQKFP